MGWGEMEDLSEEKNILKLEIDKKLEDQLLYLGKKCKINGIIIQIIGIVMCMFGVLFLPTLLFIGLTLIALGAVYIVLSLKYFKINHQYKKIVRTKNVNDMKLLISEFVKADKLTSVLMLVLVIFLVSVIYKIKMTIS